MRRWGGGVFLDIYKTLIYISDYLNRTTHLDIYILYLWFDSTFGDFFFPAVPQNGKVFLE